MQTYSTLPTALLEGWVSRDTTHPPLEQVPFHYHHAEEWLEVTRGAITFYSLSEHAWPLAQGSVFRIPHGEVHRAEIGPSGVTYRMHVPMDVASGFSIPVSGDDLTLLKTNLLFPVCEENADGGARQFFTDHLSADLDFARGDGKVVDKQTFLQEFKSMQRSSDGTVRILNRTPDAILISTGVTIRTGTPDAKSFVNVRLFKQESGAWKCRLWVNFPASPSPKGVAAAIT